MKLNIFAVYLAQMQDDELLEVPVFWLSLEGFQPLNCFLLFSISWLQEKHFKEYEENKNKTETGDFKQWLFFGS